MSNNPLLEQIPRITSLTMLKKQLRCDPLKGIDVHNLDIFERDELLLSDNKPYSPLSSSLRVVTTLIGMMRASYKSRNPCEIANQRTLLTMHMETEGDKLPRIPFGTCMGYLIEGITGVGKTAVLARLRKMLPDCIMHDRNEAAGWNQQLQIPILMVSMADEGSRGGLIEAILTKIDDIPGQNYAMAYPKKYRTVDRIAVQLPLLLHRYFVGLLIVEEVQSRNLVTSPQSTVMQLLLLSIMNAGIPLVLVGNPTGFSWLDDFSQDQRRLNQYSPEIIHPMDVQSPQFDADWQLFFSAIYDFNVLDEKPQGNKSRLSHVLRSLSGGIPGIAIIIWNSAQRMMLFTDTKKKCVSEETLKAAYLNEGFDALRTLADGFTYRDPIRLRSCQDIPISLYMDRWGLGKAMPGEIEEDSSVINIRETNTLKKSGKKISEQAKMKGAHTREQRKNAKRDALKRKLPDDDLRSKGVRKMHIDCLREIINSDKEKNQ